MTGLGLSWDPRRAVLLRPGYRSKSEIAEVDPGGPVVCIRKTAPGRLGKRSWLRCEPSSSSPGGIRICPAQTLSNPNPVPLAPVRRCVKVSCCVIQWPPPVPFS